MSPRITVVLNVYKRVRFFEQQLEAIKAQTLPAFEVLVWENGEDSVPIHLRDGLIVSRSNQNLGVWARFAFALNAKGDFICILDDDTIPGPKWLENCYQTMLISPGLLGTRGIIFESGLSYSLNSDIGVHAPNDDIRQVDIVGHAWFFKTEWLSAYWAEFGSKFNDDYAGEDIHFSYAIQKHLGLKTFVPPHPLTNQDLWGSQIAFAVDYGTGVESISKSSGSLRRFEKALQHYRKQGFQVLAEQEIHSTRFPKYIYWLTQKLPITMHKIAKRVKRKL